MIYTIRGLMDKLISYTDVEDSRISSESIKLLESMETEYKKLEASNDHDTQKKMITLFMGGVLLALNQDDTKKAHFLKVKLYPRDTVSVVKKNLACQKLTNAEYMYQVGEEALKNLPNSFCGGLFKRTSNLMGEDKLLPLFPLLAEHSKEVDALVGFCINSRSIKNGLERANINFDVDPAYTFAESFITEFTKKHQQSLKSGLFGGFFNRTNLKEYKSLTPDDILNHAKDTTFFGGKNRTRKILEEMKILDENGTLIQDEVKSDLLK